MISRSDKVLLSFTSVVTMFVFQLFFCVISFATSFPEGKRENPKIIGGTVTPIENTPYQVALYRYRQRSSECGGAIISEYAVITAAHCVRDLSIDDVTFSAGSNFNNRSGSIHRADWIVIHYDYDWTTLANDLAFVKVVESFVFSSLIKAATLPSAAPPAGTIATVSGWGELHVDDAQLQSVTLPIISLTTCETKYANFDLHPSVDMLCAGPTSTTQGPCDGDAGGPLVVEGTLVGVVSWGSDCGIPDYPSVFANVFYFRDFIDENLSYIRQ